VDQNWYIDEDMNCKKLGKFSSADDDHKLKYMQKSYGVTFLTLPVTVMSKIFQIFSYIIYQNI